MPEYQTINAVPVGRHSAVEDDETCTRAVKKELLVRADTIVPKLYARSVCDGCGTISFGESEFKEIEEEDDE